MKNFLFLLILLCFTTLSGEVFISPLPTVKNNYLLNSNFEKTVKCTEKQKLYFKNKNLVIKNNLLPQDFTLIASGRKVDTKGSIALEYLPNKKSRYLSINTPHNKFDSGVAFISKTLPKIKSNAQDPIYCGMWAKGNGTLIIKMLHEKNKNLIDLQVEKILVVPSWHYYRVKIADKNLQKSNIKLSISAYGQVDIAYPELSSLPAVDKSAELLFYAPFENGSLSALFSRGPISSYGTPSLLAVKGKFNQAVRLDRKRHFGPKGELLYPLGFGYDFLGKALNKERGTIEFFFRPLPEMLEKQPWGNIYPLFYLGDTTWQWANVQDFSLNLTLLPNNKLKLTCAEYLRKKSWPNEILLPNNVDTTESAFIPDTNYVGKFQNYTIKPYGEYLINNAKEFIEKFHHLAFTYDENHRTVWLDGKAVIKLKPLKKVAISSNVPKLLFANSNVTHPATLTSDLDELKIYSGVKYHKAFTPSAQAPKLIKIASPKEEKIPYTWKMDKPYLSKDKKFLCFPLKRGSKKYTLEVSCADGLPLIFSPKNGSFNIKTDYQIEMPLLNFDTVKVNDNLVELANKKRNIVLQCKLLNNNRHCQLQLKIIKLPSRFRAYLEPHVTLKTTKYSWQYAFDGAEKRNILLPFTPFEFEDMFMALPVVAAWNKSNGSALSLSGKSLCSWMSRSMSASNALTLKLRTVLNNQENISFNFDIFSFNPQYDENDAIDFYHSLYPQFFKLDKKADAKIYGNNALSEVWNNAAYQQRKKDFSLQELNRKTRSSWGWYYYDSSSTGNFSTDKELLEELAPINIRHLGNWNYHYDFLSKKLLEWKNLKNIGILPGLYISSWLDKRFQRYYNYSNYESNEAYNGINYWPQYWCRNVIDHVMLPTGTEYGNALRNQVKNMLKNVKDTNLLSYDLCGYNYKFRQKNTLGGLNAFDEHGSYLQHVTALALLLDDIKKMKNHSNYRTSVIGNVDINLSGYPSSFRQDNTIHEQQLLLTLQAKHLRRRQTRLQGEKPTSFMNMPPLDGNFFEDEDPRLLRYAAIASHHNRVLMGMLFNIRQSFEIFGVKESVEVLDALLRTQNQGYKQTVGAKIDGKLELARYGTTSRGTIAVVNSSPFEQKGNLKIDKDYFNAVPLVAIEGPKILVDNCNIQLDKILPLSWQLVELVAAIPGKEKLVYSSILERNFDKVTANISFLQKANLKGMIITSLDKEAILLKLNGKKITQVPETVNKNDTLSITFNNTTWKTNAQNIIDFNYLKNQVITISYKGKNSKNAADMIAEFFRWYFTVKKLKYTVKIVPQNGIIQVVEDNNQASLITLDNNQIILKGKTQEMQNLTLEFLRALDKRFVWHGVFGTQQPTRFLDWAATGRQNKFQKRHNLIGKEVSVQQIVKDFQEYIKEKNITTNKGF